MYIKPGLPVKNFLASAFIIVAAHGFSVRYTASTVKISVTNRKPVGSNDGACILIHKLLRFLLQFFSFTEPISKVPKSLNHQVRWGGSHFRGFRW